MEQTFQFKKINYLRHIGMDSEISANTENNLAEDIIQIKGRILFVDDEENILTSLKRLMRKQPVESFFATGGQEGLEVLEKEHIDIIVSDMRMPNMTGAEFLSICKTRWPKTIRILLTGHSDISSTISALNDGGIFRYLHKPWDDQELVECIEQGFTMTRLEKEKNELLDITNRNNQKLFKFNSVLEKQVASRTEEIKQTSDMLELVYQQLHDSFTNFIKLFSSVIANRKHLEKTHISHVAELAKCLAATLKLPSDEINNIYQSALLIDLGKLSLPDSILECAEEYLTADQKAQFERHPLSAEMTLSAIPELEPLAHIVRSHMECVDGSGFPNKLKGSAIPRGSRIIKVARDFIGLQTGLLKDIKLDSNEAMKIIKLLSGKKYDPFIVKTLGPLSEEFSLDKKQANEIRIDPLQLAEGMVVSRDIFNSNGILMIAKDFVLNSSIIEKLLSFTESGEAHLKIFVYKEEVKDDNNSVH